MVTLIEIRFTVTEDAREWSFFAISSVNRLQIMGSESRTLVPPNRTNRSSPGSSSGPSHSPGAFSDAAVGIAQVVRGLLRSEKNGLSRSRGAFLGASLPPSGTAVS